MRIGLVPLLRTDYTHGKAALLCYGSLARYSGRGSVVTLHHVGDRRRGIIRHFAACGRDRSRLRDWQSGCAYLGVPAVSAKAMTRLHRRVTIGTLLGHKIILTSTRKIRRNGRLQGCRKTGLSIRVYAMQNWSVKKTGARRHG